MVSFRSGSAGGRMGSRGWAALALLLLPLTASAGPNPNYRWDESKNRPGPNRCRTDSQCDGARSCSPSGWCQGEARPAPPPPPPSRPMPPSRPTPPPPPPPPSRPDWHNGRDDFRTERPTFIRSRLDGLVLDISGNNRASGAEVIGHPAKHRRDGIDNQQWELVPARGGYYIRSRLNGFVLDVWGNNRDAGAQVRVGQVNGGANQIWRLIPSHVRGYYFIESALNGYVLDIEGARTNGRLIVHPRKSSGIENQLWEFDR